MRAPPVGTIPRVVPAGTDPGYRDRGVLRHIPLLRKQEARLGGVAAKIQWLESNLKWFRWAE